jgi:hypothetical protein
MTLFEVEMGGSQTTESSLGVSYDHCFFGQGGIVEGAEDADDGAGIVPH